MTTRLPALVALLLALLLTLGSACRLAAPAADGPEPHQPLVEPELPDVTAAPDDPPAGSGGADLLIAEVMVSDGNPAAGGTFVLSVIVGNDGTAAAPATRVRFVRSADEAITTDDSEVGMVELPPIAVAGRAGGSAVVSAPESGGTFHYGACVEAVSGESETGNNCSAAVAVVVAASGEPGQPPEPGGPGPGPPEPAQSGADLTVAAPMASDPNPAAGASFALSATVRNGGTAASNATKVRFFRSTDGTISVADTEVGVADVPALAASGSVTRSVVVSAPAAGGTFHYGSCVEAVSGESETGNNCSAAVAVVVAASGEPAQSGADLTVAAPMASDANPAAGASFTLSATVRNGGTEDSHATTLRFFRSTDGTISIADTEVAAVQVSGVAASGSVTRSVVVSAPAAGGTFHYGACVDAVRNEADTGNNCSPAVAVVVASGEPGRPPGRGPIDPPSSGADLTVTVVVAHRDPAASESYRLSASVINGGTEDSHATTLRFFRSTDGTITVDDTQVAVVDVPALAASGSITKWVVVSAPALGGTFYYGACVDAVSGESETGNNCSPPFNSHGSGTAVGQPRSSYRFHGAHRFQQSRLGS